MSIALRQSTASQEIPLGYFLDSLDGNSEEVALTIANTDIKIWKSGATTLANKNSGGATHISNGIYYAVLDATDTDTVGSLVIFCHPTGALATRTECYVYEETIFDALFAAAAPGYLQPTTAGRTLDVTATGAAGVDWGNVENPTTTVGLSGTTISVATNVVSVATGAITSNSFAAAAITSSAFGTGAITAGVIAADAIGASELAADAVAEIQSGLASAIATVDTVVDAIKAKTDYLPSATAGAAGGVFIAGSNAATSITTALTANITGNVSGSIGSLGATAKTDVNTEVDTALADIHLDHLLAVDYDPAAKPGTATALLNELIESDGGVSRYTANALEQAPSGTGASAATIADAVWDEVLSGHLTAGSTGEALNAAGAAGDPWTTALPGAYGAGSAGKIIGDNINAPIATVDTVVDAIKAKTDNLPTDPADQSAVEAAITAATSPLATAANLAIIDDFLDTEIAAIKAKTDNLPGSPAAVGSAMTLATGAVSADALAADAVDEILDEIVEGSTTLRQAMRALLSLAAGKSSRSGSTIYLRDIGDTKNRVAITHDSNADRTAVTVDLT